MSWLYGKPGASDNASDDDSEDKRARSNTSDNPNVEKAGEGDWIVKQGGTGITLSHHTSKRLAEAEAARNE